MKALLWEGDGFLLLTKRLEGGHFCWPRTSTDVRNLTPEQFRWLMQGFAIDPQIKTVYPTEIVREAGYKDVSKFKKVFE